MELPSPHPAAPASRWTGRTDGTGPQHRRWHQAVHLQEELATASQYVPQEPREGIAVVGFCSDEGVRRNHGRPGAVSGPAALRSALAPLALHEDFSVLDAGDITVDGDDLEAGQRRLGAATTELLNQHSLTIVLGGGHETAYGSYLGMAGSHRVAEEQRVGILNLDAHFDLRNAPQPTSGTPFRQIAESEHNAGRPFLYAVVGISRPNNTRALFDTAADLGVEHLLDEQCATHTGQVSEFVEKFLAQIDVLHLSIDLDVLPAAVAPGVSAPASFGVPLDVINAICHQVAASGKLALMDVVELNPTYDIDNRTARTAARLITTVAHTAAEHHR
ncbi:formimidoylglutamase [Kocuria sp. SM24M-10]|uniref:formimidoylglutamase n=1 Tax=Kocuria sp. SM24M-10 TaxID=1660349 RepID=UPI00064B2580|nr:formimidoylglutamase [Kocuria sp. SM24M-10]KLU09035.1 formimidoylglutamase [Kocuria sp. SM24M-10]